MVLFAKIYVSILAMIKINRLSDYAIVLLAQLAKEEGIALTTTQLSEQNSFAISCRA